ncbi:cell division protein PerM [Kitasatospora sp. NPDC004289]
MTQLMGRPILGLPGELGVRPFLADLLAGVRTALLTLALVAVPVLALWVVTPYADDTAAGAGRVAGALWLLGHGAPLARGPAGVPLTLTPLLPTVVTAVLLVRTGQRLGRRERLHWRAPLAVCAGYLTVALAAVAHCSGEGELRARPLPDLAAVALLVAVSLGVGVGSVDGRLRLPARLVLPERWRERVPAMARPTGGGPAVLRAAGAGVLGLVGAGAAVFGGTVLLGLGAAGRSAADFGGGPATVGGLALACALLVPNAVLWAACYALGPGFAVGTGTVVAPLGARVGEMPDFPLFALLPESGAAGWWPAVCVLPLLAGLVPAALLGRAALRGEWHPVATALAALGSSLLAGASAGLAAWAAGGALAADRMARLGPVPWQSAVATLAWLAAVTVPGALLTRVWPALTTRHLSRARRATHAALVRLSELGSRSSDD